MNSIRSALRSARENHQDIDDLLKAARVILKLTEVRLTVGLASAAAREPGALSQASREVQGLHSICELLGELSMGLSATGRDSIQHAAQLIQQSEDSDADLVPLVKDCHGCLKELNSAVQVVQSMQSTIRSCQEVLDEAALRSETLPEIRAETAALIGRLRGGPGG